MDGSDGDTFSQFYISLEPEKYGYCFYYDHGLEKNFFFATSTLAFFQSIDEFLSSGRPLDDDNLKDAILLPLKISWNSHRE